MGNDRLARAQAAALGPCCVDAPALQRRWVSPASRCTRPCCLLWPRPTHAAGSLRPRGPACSYRTRSLSRGQTSGAGARAALGRVTRGPVTRCGPRSPPGLALPTGGGLGAVQPLGAGGPWPPAAVSCRFAALALPCPRLPSCVSSYTGSRLSPDTHQHTHEAPPG